MAMFAAQRKHNETVLANLKPGDLIQFPRGGYSHWAVYMGEGKVAHLTGEDDDGLNPAASGSGHVFTISGALFNKAEVRLDSFWEVVDNSFAQINNQYDLESSPFSPGEIIERVMSNLGEVGYNVLYRNCEHFAKWCRNGKAKSEQAETAMTGLGLGLAAVGGVVAVGLAVAAILSKDEKKENEKHEEQS